MHAIQGMKENELSGSCEQEPSSAEERITPTKVRFFCAEGDDDRAVNSLPRAVRSKSNRRKSGRLDPLFLSLHKEHDFTSRNVDEMTSRRTIDWGIKPTPVDDSESDPFGLPVLSEDEDDFDFDECESPPILGIEAPQSMRSVKFQPSMQSVAEDSECAGSSFDKVTSRSERINMIGTLSSPDDRPLPTGPKRNKPFKL